MNWNAALLLSTMCLGLPGGLLVAAQTTEQCSLRFRLHPNDLLNPRYRVVFTGLTPEELVANNNINIGPRIICDCTVEGLAQRHWLDIYGNVLPTDRNLVVDYRVRLPDEQPGTAVILRINKNRFSCTEAGTYTCVIGNNNRTLLVTPFGVNCAPNVALLTSFICPVNTGMNVTMQCLAKDPTGSGLTYVWLRNGFQINQALSPTLMLVGVVPEDRGTYVCRVTNRLGQGIASTFLEVIDPLPTPKDATSTPERVTDAPEEITSISEVTAISEEMTSTLVNTTIAQVVSSSTPVEIEVGVTNTLVEVTTVPLGVNSTSVEVMSNPVDLTSIQVETLITPLEVTSTTEEVTRTTEEMTSHPPDVTSTPVEIRITIAEMTSTPVEMTSSPLHVTNTLMEAITTPVEVTSPPADVTSMSVEAKSLPMEVTTLFEEASSSSVQPTFSLHEPLATSFLSSSPHSMATSLLSPMLSGSLAPSARETVEGPLPSSITDPSPAQSLSSSLTPFPSGYLPSPTAGTSASVFGDYSVLLPSSSIFPTPLALQEPVAGWEIAVIVICLLVLACITVTTVLLCCLVVYCMVAKRKGAYSVSATEEMNKVNYGVKMEETTSLDQNQGHSSSVAPA